MNDFIVDIVKGKPMHIHDELTRRERQVLGFVVKGLRNKQIANMLFIKESTVENHLHRIFRKLNATTRTEAAVIAIRDGIIMDKERGDPSGQAKQTILHSRR